MTQTRSISWLTVDDISKYSAILDFQAVAKLESFFFLKKNWIRREEVV